jgi:glycosyltransferase involved in cell wall biosynthesis
MHRILILAPTFFPDTVVAAVRVGQWARHLPEFGWSPLVLCRHRGYTVTPEELAERFNREVRVEYLGPRAAKPVALGSASTMARMLDLVSVPDALIWKWKSLAPQAIAIAQQHKPNVVLSSSTPHSIHALGRTIAKETGAAWVADYRDPYLIDDRHQPQGLKRLFIGQHRQFERGLYRDAALSVHAIPLHARWASRQYPFARNKIRTLTNGIPAELLDEQFLQSARNNRPEGARRVSVRTVGVMGLGAVEMLAGAVRQLVENGIDAEFRHVGAPRDSADDIPADMRNRFHLLGSVSHLEAMRLVAGADVLVKHEDEKRAKTTGLSSKLFEYLATGRPIVAINPTVPDLRLIGRLPWCWRLTNPTPSDVAQAMQQAIATAAGPPEAWLKKFREQYNRRNQTRQLAAWLDEIVK